jgi:membrane associated rhomboid family serine protease
VTEEVGWAGLATVVGVSWQQALPAERRRSTAGTAAQVILLFVAILYVVEVLDQVSGSRLQRAGGLEPLESRGLDGILFAPMLHGPWEHLLANTVPLLIFGFLLLLAGARRWLAVTAVVWLVGGVGVWLTGGVGTVHIGASVLIFGWLVYLLLRGFFSRHPGQVALGVLLLIIYGGVLWGVLPGQPGVSWQGHLFGAIGGALAAWWFGRADRAAGRSPGWP